MKHAVNFNILEEIFVVKSQPNREKNDLEKLFMNKYRKPEENRKKRNINGMKNDE